MKKIFGLFALALVAAGFTSCDYDSDDDSYVTHYVNIEITGGSTYLVPVGSTYTDPGYTATEGTEDVTSKVVVGGDEVDGNTVGVYNVTYSAANIDGFSSSTSRRVLVYDPSITTDISGTYTVESAQRFRFSTEATTGYSGNEVTVTKLANGMFAFSDMLGGYYAQKPNNYGSSYAMSGTAKLNADNTLELLTSYVPGWGDSADYCHDFVCDPTTGKISFAVGYAGAFEFTVVLQKN